MKYLDCCVFYGTYGGSNYELHLINELKSRDLSINETYIKRDGWFKTCINIFKSYFKVIFSKKRLLRSFTIPVYKKDMYVIIHHLDNKYDPWYCKLIENIDFYILKKFNYYLNTRIICVSVFWQKYFLRNGFKNVLLFYNTLSIKLDEECDSRCYISSKYSIDSNKKWIFLGSSSKKKGAQSVLKIFQNTVDVHEYEFICTGNNDEIDCNTIWFEKDDYFKFLSNCYLIALNPFFQEGWCRIAHESVLLGVPVLANGSGGMQELLDLSGIETVKFDNFTITNCDLNRYVGNKNTLNSHISESNFIFLNYFKKDLQIC